MTTETSIYEYAKQGLAVSASKAVLSFYGKNVSFAELFRRVDCVAENLFRLGVRKGTVVTIHLPNCPQAVVAIYAVAKLGGICNMVHALTPKELLRENLGFTESSIVITHNSEIIWEGVKVVLVDVSHHMGTLYKIGYRLKQRNRPESKAQVFELLEKKRVTGAVFPDPETLALECAVYLHSSGSTGNPKTVCLSHSALNNCVANTEDFFENADMAQQVSLGVLPLFHGFGLAMDVHRNVSQGSKLILMARWDTTVAVRTIKKQKVSLMVGVPTMYYALLNHPNFRGKGINSLSKCFVGGDNVKSELITSFNARVGKERCMYVGFGLTEATTANCVNTYKYYKTGSSGYPVRNTTVAIIDKNGVLSSVGEGELAISSKTLMMGYLKNSEATAKTLFYAEGKQWTRTGDHVLIDNDGFVYFQSRIKNIIIRNGYNIYPEQIETVIRKVPGISDVCVVGVLDEILHTQIIRAVVIPTEACDITDLEQEIRQECLERLPRFSVPQQVRFLKTFPQNAMGKIDRRELSLP